MLIDLFYPYQLGGAEKQFYELAVRLAKKHEVHVYTLNIEGCPSDEKINGVYIHRIGYRNPSKNRSLLSLLTYFMKTPYILKEIRKFDIIHANQISSLFSFFKWHIKKPFVVTIHDIYWDQWKDYYKFPLYYIGKSMELLLSKLNYDKIITVSKASKNKIRKLGFRSSIDILHNGIDFKKISNIQYKKQNHFVYIGRLVNYKNVDKIIIAMKKINELYPDIQLRIVGSGEQKNYLENLAKKLNVNVKFLGYLNEEDKFKEIKTARAFVSMSSIEGFGISLLEAMACGTPVVAKKLDAYEEFCNSNNSLLINEKDLEKTLLNLLSDIKLQKKLAKEGLETAEKFDWNNSVKNLEKIYNSV